MLKETTLDFSGLSDSTDLFRNDFSLSTHEEDSDDGETIYAAIMQHGSLGLSQTIRDANENILAFKSQQVLNQWIQHWNQKKVVGSKLDRIITFQQEWDTLLSKSLDKNHSVDLELLKNKEPFETSLKFGELQSKLDCILVPSPPRKGNTPPKPLYHEPAVRFMDKLLFKKKSILTRYQKEYDRKLETWQKICDKIEQNQIDRMAEYELALQSMEKEKQAVSEEMDAARQLYEEERLRKNEGTDILQINYQSKQPEAVEQYVELVVMQSAYPDLFPRHTELEYHRDNHTLLVSMELPHPNLIPREKDLRFNSTDQKEEITYYSAEEFSNLYNDIIYKTILRTFHEIFSADEAEAVEAIHFKGWVRTLNRGNGQYENTHIASVFSSRSAFEKINLKQIDPTLCFRFLKGVSSPALIDLTEIPEPFTISKKQREEMPVKKMLEPIDNSTNLANLGWKDFETLMISLLEKEFGVTGAEINVLQSSLEAGLEAYSQDPDPIRGGKILFHARRSIKPIPVSPVRELFGSVIHEGAVKGILITTADFTTEAYEFARNKPIRLLNGSSLLSLFEKHGQKLRINLREAISLETWLS
jgi:restriction system protein